MAVDAHKLAWPPACSPHPTPNNDHQRVAERPGRVGRRRRVRVGRCRVPVWPPLALAEAVSVSGHAKGRCCGKSRGAAA
eukprot:CAMPEP_0174360992 /NCGR_PEP_ID=MMETSP0811_2-20130205/57197_1 /TAXON_ID=73025 ORGANISM="Eutreptiella gymnastica-like, Strain CCMP1594" /NCGR_SAMPLE_ID=MMETSP0811_2 /ASSEMBLY_ACC=CAM_ASM_000667 /LENGTH=78 /DNA_ID=CAMNT_0015497287 /DNA_START=477 /DNA_END=710 /DNA_ORIENTATION=-